MIKLLIFLFLHIQSLVIALILLHRQKGIHTSGSLFLFWSMLTVTAVLNYRLIFVYYWGNPTVENLNYNETEKSYIFKTIEFPVILSQLFLAFFADLRSQFTSPGQEITVRFFS